MSEQGPLVPVHRRHWYANDNGAVPDHVALSTLRVWPSSAVPEIEGAAEFDGGFAVTAAVGAEVALAEPSPFVAFTTTRRVLPISAPVRSWVEPVAPLMSAHLAPVPSQRRHWYA